jgi:hypothetical protein
MKGAALLIEQFYSVKIVASNRNNFAHKKTTVAEERRRLQMPTSGGAIATTKTVKF